jgi:hypothetical protein
MNSLVPAISTPCANIMVLLRGDVVLCPFSEYRSALLVALWEVVVSVNDAGDAKKETKSSAC